MRGKRDGSGFAFIVAAGVIFSAMMMQRTEKSDDSRKVSGDSVDVDVDVDDDESIVVAGSRQYNEVTWSNCPQIVVSRCVLTYYTPEQWAYLTNYARAHSGRVDHVNVSVRWEDEAWGRRGIQ